MRITKQQAGSAYPLLVWVLVVLGLTACATVNKQTAEPSADCPLCGEWQSNEIYTLRDMYAYGEVTPEQLDLFTDGYFGRLIIEFKAEKLRWRTNDRGAEPSAWQPYEVLSSTADTIRIASIDPQINEPVEQTLRSEHLDDHEACFSMPLPELGFREYFCR